MSNVASAKPRVAKGRRYLGSEIVFNVILTIFVLLCILPVIHVIAKSISGRAPVVAGKVYLLPKDIDFSAYASIPSKNSQLSTLHSPLITHLPRTLFINRS